MGNVKSQPKRNLLGKVDAFNEFSFNLNELKSRFTTNDTRMTGPLEYMLQAYHTQTHTCVAYLRNWTNWMLWCNAAHAKMKMTEHNNKFVWRMTLVGIPPRPFRRNGISGINFVVTHSPTASQKMRPRYVYTVYSVLYTIYLNGNIPYVSRLSTKSTIPTEHHVTHIERTPFEMSRNSIFILDPIKQ